MQKVNIFTDGSSRGNPGPGGWGAIIATETDVVEIGGGEKHTTNNRMELMAVIKSLEFVSKLKIKKSQLSATINTDSSYVLNSATKWVYGWQKNDWKTTLKDDVLNRDLWEEFLEASKGLKLEWNLLKGHSGVPTNERCDVIATSFADGGNLKLYTGTQSDYEIDVSISKINNPKVKPKSSSSKSSSKKGVTYSYVSEINGVVKTHKTWDECEARVKGKSRAHFKKVFSLDEEKVLIASWRKIS